MNETSDSPSPQVVVVNDDLVQLKILAHMLLRAGFECRSYSGPEEALSELEPQNPPALIVTDLHMPGIDGWRFCRLLRSPEYEAFNHLPILVISATFAGDDTRRITAATGADAFLPAPVEKESFLNTVRSLIDSQPQAHNRACCLLVDDSPTIRNLLCRSFSNRGYDCLEAADAAGARRLYKENSPEIVVLDYHLPDGNGEELLAEFTQARHFAVFVMITTDPKPELALRWMKMGAAAYARKPFAPEYLLTLCENAARERVMMRVEEMLEQKTRSLIEAQRMEAVGHLAGGLAHDFNNILQIIYGFIDMALLNLTPEHQVAGYLRKITAAADRARNLVDQLLAFSRRQVTLPEELDFSQLINRNSRPLQRLLGEQISFHYLPEEPLPVIRVDVRQLERALFDLCLNAREAMPEGGRLTISCARREISQPVAADHNPMPPGDYLEVRISDNGPGMAPEVRRHAFDPFFTTKGKAQASGMGLSTVYGVIHQNHGFVELESEPGRGTSVIILLPAKNRDQKPGLSEKSTSPGHR